MADSAEAGSVAAGSAAGSLAAGFAEASNSGGAVREIWPEGLKARRVETSLEPLLYVTGRCMPRGQAIVGVGGVGRPMNVSSASSASSALGLLAAAATAEFR